MLQESLHLSLREWINRYQDVVVSSAITYKGIPIWKNVLDLWIYQEIIYETRPEVIVEVGCKFGGSAVWFADTLRSIGDGAVITIDLLPRPERLPSTIQFVQGDSTSPAVVGSVAKFCAGRRAMVILDSNHSADHVERELQLYTPLVPVGGYLIVEDSIVDVMDWDAFTPGPQVAIHRFLATDGGFEIDHTRERFVLTYNPDGFLRRVRPAAKSFA